jgi:preprotein translocase subunit SecE
MSRNILQVTYDELVNKVTWPTTEELINSSIVVLVATLIISLLIQGMDLVSSKMLRDIVYPFLLG